MKETSAIINVMQATCTEMLALPFQFFFRVSDKNIPMQMDESFFGTILLEITVLQRVGM